MALIAALPEGMHGSTRDDLERGMRLELPWLCGRVAELGRKHGLATPVNDAVVLGLKLHSATAAVGDVRLRAASAFDCPA